MAIERTMISEMVQSAIQKSIAPALFESKLSKAVESLDEAILESIQQEIPVLEESVLSKLSALMSTATGAVVGGVGTAAAVSAGILAGASGGAINYLSTANIIKMLSLINPFNGVTSVGLTSTTKILGMSLSIPNVGLAGTTIGTLPVSWVALMALAGAGVGALTGYMAYRGIKYAMRPKMVKIAEQIAKLTKKRDALMIEISGSPADEASKPFKKFEKLTLEIQKLGSDLEREVAREEMDAYKSSNAPSAPTKEDVMKIIQLVKDGRMTYADPTGRPMLTREGLEEDGEFFLSEADQVLIQESILNEGFGSTVIRILGALGGGAVGSWVGSLGGSLAGAGIGGVLMALGMSAPVLVAAVYGGSVIGGIAGLVWGVMKGYEIASNLTGGNHEKATAKLLKVTKQRDDLLTKMTEDAKAGKEPTSSDASKLDNLTSKQVEAARYLERQANIAKAAGKLSGDDVKVVDDLVAKGSQGKLTLIKTK